MIKEEKFKIKCTYNNISYLKKINNLIKFGEEIELFTNELPINSSKKVTIYCDECKKESKKRYSIYCKIIQKNNGIYLCKDCFNKNKEFLEQKVQRTKETCLKKYGKENPNQVSDFLEKAKRTKINKYGTDKISSLPEIKEKIQQTCLKKYGVFCVLMLPENIKKGKDAMLKKYGVTNPTEIKGIREKIKNTCQNRYNVDNVLELDWVQEKIQKSLFERGKVRTSSQQVKIYELLKNDFNTCILNYPYGSLFLDCYIEINNIKIDIEYDGWYWHQNKQKDIKRDKFLEKNGFKILRIKGHSKIPSKKELKSSINELINTNKYFIELIIEKE